MVWLAPTRSRGRCRAAPTTTTRGQRAARLATVIGASTPAVVDAVRAALGATVDASPAAAAPELLVLRNVIHLRTPRFEVAVGPSTHVLDLVARLHPTPAVAGAPREAALSWLAAREPIGRGWYAGAVGWFDARGEGSFRVAIRSGVVAGARAWLYAGAGIVRGSDPSREYAEVRAKLAPMLEALEAQP